MNRRDDPVLSDFTLCLRQENTLRNERAILSAAIVALLPRHELGANVASEVSAVHEYGVHRTHRAQLAHDLVLQLLCFLNVFLYFRIEAADLGR